MTRVQKVFCVFLCLCFLVVLAVMPEPFSLWKIIENVYRQFPLYYFIEEKTQETWLETDKQTLAQIARENGKYLGQQMQSKNKTEEDNIEEKKEWKKQTVNTFLTRLAQKGFLNIDKSGKRAIYIPTVTSKEYYEEYAQKVLDDSFHGSLKNFICAFTGNHKLSGEEKAELLAYIEEL